MPWSVVVAFAVNLLCAAACVIILRNAAERLRHLAIDRLSALLMVTYGSRLLEPWLARRLELMLHDVREISRGAFAPMMHQPLVKAALLPLGGAGGIAVIEYLFVHW